MEGKETLLQKAINSLNKGEVVAYYSNHSIKSCAHHFNISYDLMIRVFNYWKISRHTTKEQHILSFKEIYGVDNVFKLDSVKQKIKETKYTKYGNPYRNDNKIRQTNYLKYGSASPFSSKMVRDKARQTLMDRFGVDNASKSKTTVEKIKQTKFERYGSCNYNNKEKQKQTLINKYGVTNSYMLSSYKKVSKVNLEFKNLINLDVSQEISLYNKDLDRIFIYDFQIDNTFIEINPTITHNSNISVKNMVVHDCNYHLNKALTAWKNNDNCIMIWDWDDKIECIKQLKYTRNIKAEKCKIEVKESSNHLQINMFNKNILILSMIFEKISSQKLFLLDNCISLNFHLKRRCLEYIKNNFNYKEIEILVDCSKENPLNYEREITSNITWIKPQPIKAWLKSLEREVIVYNCGYIKISI